MGSMSGFQVPVINFSKEDLIPGTDSWNLVQGQVRRALEECGCFEAVYDKVRPELCEQMFGVMDDLFSLPLETKLQNVADIPYHGYIGGIPFMPLYQSMGIEDAKAMEEVEGFTKLMWPEGNPKFCETTYSFATQVLAFEQIVKRMIYRSLGLEKYYDPEMKSTTHLLRFMKYEGKRTDESEIGLVSHTDKNFITILYQNKVNGLELQKKDGEWISIAPSATSFTVMIGEALMAWSNGILHSPHHRVMVNEDGIRYAIGLFEFGKHVETPAELVDDDHPLKFKPFENMDLLRYFFTPEGHKKECTVKAYCGV